MASDSRRTLLQARQRLVDCRVVDRRFLAAQCQAGVVTGIDGRNRFKAGRELEGLTFFDDDVLDVRGIDRLDAACAKRLVDGPRDEPVRHVVEDLVAESLPNDLGRNLAGTEAWDTGGSAIVPRDLVDLGIDDGARDLDEQLLAGIGNVDELGLHGSVCCGTRTRRQVNYLP